LLVALALSFACARSIIQVQRDPDRLEADAATALDATTALDAATALDTTTASDAATDVIPHCGSDSVVDPGPCICTPQPFTQLCEQRSYACGDLNTVENCGTRRSGSCGTCELPEVCVASDGYQFCTDGAIALTISHENVSGEQNHLDFPLLIVGDSLPSYCFEVAREDGSSLAFAAHDGTSFVPAPAEVVSWGP
jgi:hypothetical protein